MLKQRRFFGILEKTKETFYSRVTVRTSTPRVFSDHLLTLAPPWLLDLDYITTSKNNLSILNFWLLLCFCQFKITTVDFTFSSNRNSSDDTSAEEQVRSIYIDYEKNISHDISLFYRIQRCIKMLLWEPQSHDQCGFCQVFILLQNVKKYVLFIGNSKVLRRSGYWI